MSWILLALLGAVATSLTTIFAKIGIKDVKSNFATAYRTGVVLICCVISCVASGSIKNIGSLSLYNWIFLLLSGLSTGLSWLCYYKALKLGSVNQVVPIDKSSFVLTSILFFIFFFDDTTNGGNVVTIIALFSSIFLMLSGTLLMITEKKGEEKSKNKIWLLYAILSAVFASFVSLFVKIGLKGISSDLGTLLRTIVVFIFAAAVAGGKGEYEGVKDISKKSWVFLTLSGVCTGAAWLLEYYALNFVGSNPVAVNSIGKLSVLLTMAFSYFILKEKFNKKSIIGLLTLTLGIIVIIIFSL